MGALLTVLPIVVRRVAANARLLVAVLIGAVFAAALMSTTAIYTDAIRDLGLTYAVRTLGPDSTNILIRSTSQGSEKATYERNRAFIEDGATQVLGRLVDGTPGAIGRSSTFFPTAPGGSVTTDEGRPRSHLQFVRELESHVRVVDGRLPAAAAFAGEGRAPSIETALGSESAQRLGLKTGDRFDLHPFWAENAEPVHATIVGIIEPVDQGEPFWRGVTDLFTYRTASWDTLPFFIAEETFFGAIAGYLPTMTSDYWSIVYLNPGRINAANAEPVRASVASYIEHTAGGIERTLVETELPQTLATYDEKLFFTRIPLLVLLLQVSGIVLYYLFMVSTMLVERQSGEIALLKSRGATTLQVMQIYIVEGLVILLLALAIGPPLAALVVSFLGQTPPFHDLSGGANLSVKLSQGAYAWAAAGAVLSYAALLIPAYLATKRTVVQQRGISARPPKEPAFTRYYLDMVLVGIGAILFYQLNRRGDLVTERLFGEQAIDPINLLTPAFFILTVGIVFLRLFPLVLRAIAWMVSRAQGVAIVIGMWQLVRNPTHYSRLVLLLMLATAVGMFAASFGETLNHSYADRAAYESGAQLRFANLGRAPAAGPDAAAERLREDTGASAATQVLRLSASQGDAFDRVEVNMLGVDPETYGDVAFFRDDFAGPSLEGLLATLGDAGRPEDAIVLPADARWLGIWLNPVDLRGRVALEARARDESGRFFSFTFGPDQGAEMQPGWYYALADLSRPDSFGGTVSYEVAPPRGRLTLLSLSIRFISRVSATSGSLQLDDLQASATGPTGGLATERLVRDPARTQRPLGAAPVIADFDSVEPWTAMQGILPQRMNDTLSVVASGGGAGQALQLQWQPGQGQPATHGLVPRAQDAAIGVLASRAFLELTGVPEGERTGLFAGGSFLYVEVIGTFELWPTLGDTRELPAIIADLDRLLDKLNENSARSATTYPDEVWLKDGSAAAARTAMASGRVIAQLVSFEELRTAQQEDPLVAAGWEGILFISFAAILVLSAIGFLIYSYLTAQKRTLEFAVLRTMGFSRRQIGAVVGFEQLFVIGLGMLAGTAMGLRLGQLMIGYMGLTETGDAVLPPMLLQVSWLTIASAWLVLAAAFVVTIGIVILLYSRLALHRVLRIGET